MLQFFPIMLRNAMCPNKLIDYNNPVQTLWALSIDTEGEVLEVPLLVPIPSFTETATSPSAK